MCLVINNLKFETAKEDIVCYKVLKRSYGFSVTPYCNVEVEFNKLCFPNTKIKTRFFFKLHRLRKVAHFLDRHKCIMYYPFPKLYYIGGGIIHLYTSKLSAESAKRIIPHSFICKAIIPKGTKYIKSMDGKEIGTLCVKYELLTYD